MKDEYFAQNFEKALAITGRSDYIKTQAWFDAGWFLQNDNNWEKCLNGKYTDNGGLTRKPADALDAAMQEVFGG